MSFTRLEPSGVNTSANFTFANVTVNGNVTSGNANLGNAATANYFIGNGSLLTGIAGTYSNADVANYLPTYTGNVSANYFIGNGALLTGIAGTYSNADVANYLPTYTGNVSANYVFGNGSGLTSLNGANVTGQVPNSLVSGTVYTAAQPNITSTGTLANVAVSGSANVGNLSVTGFVTGNLIPNANITYNLGNNNYRWNDLYLAGNSIIIGGAQIQASGADIALTGNIESGNANLGNLAVANYFSGNGSLLSSITGGNVVGQVGNALVSGTVYSASQPNITSVGTLTSLNVSINANTTDLNVSGNATVAGNLTVNGNVTYINVESLVVEDPIIELGGGPNGNALITNDGKDRGEILHYYTTAPVDAFMGWDNSNGEFAFGSNVSVASEIVTFNSFGNIRAGYFIGNGSALSSITGANVTGQVGNALVAGTVYTNAQPNITSLGTLANLAVTSNVSAGNVLTNNLLYANGVAWSFGATYSNTNVAAYLPTYTGNVAAGNVLTDNLLYANGSPYSFSSTYSNANVANYLPTYTGNVAAGNVLTDNLLYANGVAWSFGATYSNTNVAAYLPTYTGNVAASYFIGNGSALTSITGGNVTGQVSNALVAGTVYTAAQPNITSLGTLSSLTVTGLITATSNGVKTANIYDSTGTLTIETQYGNKAGDAGIYGNLTVGTSGTGNITAYNANLGNLVIGNFLQGTLTTSSQPNITSVGTLSSLTVAGNVSSGNANLGNAVTANFFIGNGSLLTGISTSSSLISNGNSNVSIGSSGGNITAGVGGTANVLILTSTGANVTGYATVSANFSAGNATVAGTLTMGSGSGGNLTGANVISANLFTGTLTTANQPNITSVGTLSSLSVTANVSAGNILTNNLLYANGVAWSFDSSYSNTNVAAYLPTYTGNVAANYFIGNGSALTSITGANVTGQVGNALIAGTVYTNAQPNITSLGTLSSLTIDGNLSSGNSNLGNLAVANFFSGNGSLLTSITGGNISGQVGNALIAGTVYTNAQPNITSLGTLTSLSITGNLSSGNSNLGNLSVANFFSGNGSLLSSITGSNVNGQVANAAIAGTVYTAAQPNITSVGTLSSLAVSGNANVSTDLNVTGNTIITGNLTVQGNTSYINVETLRVEDPIIELGGGPNGNALTTNDGKDRGTLLNYYTTAPVDAFMGWDNSNGEFAFGSNVTVTNEVVTFNTLGNLRASYIIANGSLLTSITGSNVTGQVGNALIAGTVYTNAQPNITSLGTLSSLSVTANVSAGNILSDNLLYANGVAWSFGSSYSNTNVAAYLPTYTGNVAAGNVLTNNLLYANGVAWSFGATYSNTNVAAYLPTYTGNLTADNISGANLISGNFLTGTLTTAAQPNVTSVGTLSSLTVTGLIIATSNGVRVANIYDSTGTLTIETKYGNKAGDAGVYGNLTVGTSGTGNITAYNANLGNLVIGNFLQGTLTTGAQPNITSVGTLQSTTIAANSNITLSGSLSQITGANLVSASLLTGTLTTAAQPNVTSLGTLASLNVTANISSGNANLGNLLVANFHSGNGSLLFGIVGANVTGQVSNALITSTVYTAAQPNITSVGTLQSTTIAANSNITLSGSLSQITGANLVSASLLTGALTTAAQPNITSVGTLQNTTLAANSNVTLSGSLSQITGANLVSASLFTGTLTTGAQPNVTSVGTLQSTTLAANSNVSLSGSLSQISGANLVSASFFTGVLTTGSQPNITSVGTLASLSVTGNVSAGNILTNNLLYANGVAWNFGSYSNTNVAAYLPTYTGNLTAGNISGANLISGNFLTGTLTTAAQPNITSVGSLTSLTVSGDASVTGFITSQEFTEVTQSLTGATGTVTHNVAGGIIFVHTSVSASFTANFTNVPTTDNRSIVVTIIISQGATAYIPNAVQINSVGQTINWSGGSAPTGNANKRDVFTFALLRVSGTWTVLGNSGSFG
jgi:hypothetical protein